MSTAEKPMTEDEYLRVRGWSEHKPGQWHKDFGSPLYSTWTLKQALDRQLSDDQRALAFVLARSDLTLMWPDRRLGEGVSTGHEHVEAHLAQKP